MKKMSTALKIILIMMTACSNPNFNEDFVTVCKASSDSVRLEYLDSVNGIESIEQQATQDTLTLTIKVSPIVRNEGKEIVLPKNTKHLRIGSKHYLINNIESCEEIRSGNDVLEHLKKMK